MVRQVLYGFKQIIQGLSLKNLTYYLSKIDESYFLISTLFGGYAEALCVKKLRQAYKLFRPLSHIADTRNIIISLSLKVGTKYIGQTFKHDQYSEKEKKQFVAANTVEGTFNNYIDWFYGRKFDPNVDLFTKESIPVLSRFPMTLAYFDYMLMFYVGKQYKVGKRENLAVLYFTDDPLATPLFFNRIQGKWQINTRAELRNSRNHVGGVYT